MRRRRTGAAGGPPPHVGGYGSCAGLVLAAMLFCLFVRAAETPNPSAAPAQIDTLLFKNEDILYGALASMDAAGVVTWNNADAERPIQFTPGLISEIRLGERGKTKSPPENLCQVRLANGDELEGNLVAVDDARIVLNTWYAGELTIPRQRAQFVRPLILDKPPVFEGPTGTEGWTSGKLAAGVPNAGEWKYRDGAFYATKSASIARDLNLPDVAKIEFDLTWKGVLYMAIALYTEYLHPVSLQSRETEPEFGSFYSLRLDNYTANLMPVTRTQPLRYLGQATVPSFNQKNKIHFEIRADKPKRRFVLMGDGQVIKEWTDVETPESPGVIGTGRALRFVHQGQGGIKLSNIRVSEWDGQFEEKPSNPPGSPTDLVRLKNGDKVAGKIEAIREEKASITGTGGALDISLDRIRLLEFGGFRAEEIKDRSSHVRASLRSKGHLTLTVEKWDGDKVSASHPILGKAEFNPAAFERIQFDPSPLPPPGGRTRLP